MHTLRLPFARAIGLLVALTITLTAIAYGVAPLILPATDVIAFSSRRADNTEVYMRDISRGVLLNLTDNPAFDHMPAWSPDGTRLAFASNRGPAEDVYVMALPERTLTNISRSLRSNGNPVWSPDGTRIAYTSYVPSTFTTQPRSQAVVIHDFQTNRQHEIPGDFGGNITLSWSADGRLLAFTGQEDGIRQIYVIEAAARTSTARLLITDGEWSDYPAWSPDGTSIVFARVTGSSQLYLADANGSNVRPLTDDTFWHTFPTWSTDSQQVIFTSNQNLNNDIYMIDVATGNIRRLTTHPADDYDPSWRP